VVYERVKPTYRPCSCPIHTRLHLLLAALYLLITVRTYSAHSLWPSSGNYKLHRPIQLNLWSWTKNIIVHAQTFTSNSLCNVYYLGLEAFAATEFNEIFSGRQQHQDVNVYRSFIDWLRPHLGPTKPPAHREDWDWVNSPNVSKPSHRNAAVCQRLFPWIFVIHCFYMFRPQNVALFRELQTS
jgi:hypothetical protein